MGLHGAHTVDCLDLCRLRAMDSFGMSRLLEGNATHLSTQTYGARWPRADVSVSMALSLGASPKCICNSHDWALRSPLFVAMILHREAPFCRFRAASCSLQALWPTSQVRTCRKAGSSLHAPALHLLCSLNHKLARYVRLPMSVLEAREELLQCLHTCTVDS